MQISKNRMTLVNDENASIIGYSLEFDGDYSLGALVRAISLKYDPIKPDEKPSEYFSTHAVIEKCRARSVTDAKGYLKADSGHWCIRIVECIGCFTEIVGDEEKDIKPMPITRGWHEDAVFDGKPTPVSQYLSQFARTKVFTNDASKRVVVYVDRRATHRWVRGFESVLCRMMPWYFPSTLPDDEKAFYSSIAHKKDGETPEEAAAVEETLIAYVNKAAEGIDFRSIRLHAMLDGVADRGRQRRLASIRDEITSYRNNLTRAIRQVRDYQGGLDAKLLELRGLELATPESDDAMLKFFSSATSVTVTDVGDYGLQFYVDDTLEFYDSDEFERICARSGSFVHDWDDDMYDFLRAIFADRRGVLRVSASFSLDNFTLVEPKEDVCEIDDCLPNPHIYFFGCSGGNADYYAQYAESGDWDMAVMQAISATKNLNWGDSTVCRDMIQWFSEHKNRRCIYCTDGSPMDKVSKDMKLVSYSEFMKIIRRSEKGEKVDG